MHPTESNPLLDQPKLNNDEGLVDYIDVSGPYSSNCTPHCAASPGLEESTQLSEKLNNDKDVVNYEGCMSSPSVPLVWTLDNVEDDSLYCMQSTFVFFQV